jgi:predicted transcriptional regulator
VIQQTSVDAYWTIVKNGLLSKKRMQVYEEIHKFQPISINKLIMNLSRPGLNTGSITGRISELQRLGVIEPWGTEIAPTGHEVILWKTTGNLPGKIPQKKTRRQLEKRISELELLIRSTRVRLGKEDFSGIGSLRARLEAAIGMHMDDFAKHDGAAV